MCEGWDHGLLGYGREAKKGKRRRVEGCVRVLGGLRKLTWPWSGCLPGTGNESTVAPITQSTLTLKSAGIANQLKDRSVTCTYVEYKTISYTKGQNINSNILFIPIAATCV